jgi:antitoxin MazE
VKIVKTEQGWIVRVPDDVVAALGVKDGDEVRVATAPGETEADDPEWEAVLATINGLSRPLPPGYKFDREEANAR